MLDLTTNALWAAVQGGTANDFDSCRALQDRVVIAETARAVHEIADSLAAAEAGVAKARYEVVGLAPAAAEDLRVLHAHIAYAAWRVQLSAERLSWLRAEP